MMFKDEYKKTQLKRLKVLSYFSRTRERKGEKECGAIDCDFCCVI